MSLPKISVVIPSYNQGRFLEEAILSVISQQYSNLDLLVVDGGSTDNSLNVIKKYEQHISWWISERDNGQSEAINKGFLQATGEIVTWLCSDDLLAENALETVASYFTSFNERVGLLHGGAIIFDSQRTKETRFTYLFPSKEAYLSGMTFPQPAAFLRKSYLERVGGVNESLHFGMDYDLFMRLSLVSEFKPVESVFAKYRLHDQSKSVSASSKFINDWKKSFVNLCKNLSWSDELELIKKTGLYENELSFSYNFQFQPEEYIVDTVNKHKATFLHLGHVLKDLYWTYRVDEAKRLLKMMLENFPDEWIKEDSRLDEVVAKLRLPSFALKSVRIIKQIFK